MKFLFQPLITQQWVRWVIYPLLFIFVYFKLSSFSAAQDFYNGFEIDHPLVDIRKIEPGGPARDGIPALSFPQFIKPDEAKFLNAEDVILGLSLNSIHKAYPVKILNWHELVNDRFGDDSVVVSFCPLCGTGMAFLSKIDQQTYTFGVSGLVYNSNVLFYDRETESLWSQVLGKAISGSTQGKRLKMLPLTQTTWHMWLEEHPETLVLSQDTGYSRDYSVNPYEGYDKSRAIYFSIGEQNQKYHPKELVVGVKFNGIQKAYPFAELSKGQSPLVDTVGNKSFTVEFDAARKSATVLDQNGDIYPSVITYWFAWYAFYPQGEIFHANGRRGLAQDTTEKNKL